MRRRSSVSSGLKTSISSMRLRNSGRKNFFTSSRISFLAISKDAALSLPVPVPAAKPMTGALGFKWDAPRLLVMMMTVLRKSTVRPLESVSRPSSSTCRSRLKKSPLAFSTSSNKTTLYGFSRTASVSSPPSSYPTYPGGAPTRRDTLYRSMNSLMSMRIIASWLPKS